MRKQNFIFKSLLTYTRQHKNADRAYFYKAMSDYQRSGPCLKRSGLQQKMRVTDSNNSLTSFLKSQVPEAGKQKKK